MEEKKTLVTRKPYNKPVIEKVVLAPDETVLNICGKTTELTCPSGPLVSS